MSVILNNVDRIVNSSGDTIDFAQGVGGGSSKEFVATGNIGQGQTVGLKADGTVELVQETVTQTPQTQVLGSPNSFMWSNCANVSTVFDSNSNKVVIAYRDSGNSYYGTAIVGTVSGDSISFGTRVVFNSNGITDYISATFDSFSNKVIIAYRDENYGGYGTAVVGTVSGSSISFGSPAVFNGGTYHISTAFDPNSNKVVIAYQDDNHTSNGGAAVVGTVSANSISFGSSELFSSSRSEDISATFDSNSNKIVIAYSDQGNSGHGKAVVGTVNTNNKLSFSSPVTFNSRNTQRVSATFDSKSSKVIIGYQDGGNSNYGTAIVGTVSGTDISFGSSVVFSGAATDYIFATFDPNVNKVVIAYSDMSNTYKGMVAVGEVSGTSFSSVSSVFKNGDARYISVAFESNLNKLVIAYRDGGSAGSAVVFTPAGTATIKSYNASSWLGIADEAITSGDSGKINLIGSVDSHQTGLTTGNTYYVNYDGTLTDTPNEGVENGTYGKIGKALSSTSLLLSK